MHYRRLLRHGDVGDVATRRSPQAGACTQEGCDNPAQVRGLCNMHYSRLLRWGSPDELRKVQSWAGAECLVEGCGRPVKGHGLCQLHWSRWRKYGDPGPAELLRPQSWADATCSVDDCFRPVHALGLCEMHHGRFRRHGDPGITAFRGVVSTTWLENHPDRAAEPAYLYLMRFADTDGTEFLKAGIGRAAIGYSRIRHHERHGGQLVDVVHDTLATCFFAEQALLAAMRDCAYRPTEFPSGGATECFLATSPPSLRNWLEQARAGSYSVRG